MANDGTRHESLGGLIEKGRALTIGRNVQSRNRPDRDRPASADCRPAPLGDLI